MWSVVDEKNNQIAIAVTGKRFVDNDNSKKKSGRPLLGILVLPVAMVLWILVADPTVLGQNGSHAMGKLVSSEFGIKLGNRGMMEWR